ncbi:alanine racemase [Pusillimonas sp. MFBS29]|uniref:alanine racemase n=1 Tax=Pusillimonas sp. MFBS29 TaxID=2886690 RepID=UPI001D104180|nr:alanine racemase [Pusillimonas sp. MFBS29]MCC2597572.1 alanine racemase [Pusillimonas sp. MFBS29]
MTGPHSVKAHFAGACGSPVALIDHSAISHNLKRLRQLLARPAPQSSPRIWAVAKADAYGHTLELAYPGLSGADGLAVLTLDEARRCRRMGWTGPILAMSVQCSPAMLEDPALYPLHLIIDDPQQLGILQFLRPPCVPHVWLRYRGRLNHAGLTGADYQTIYALLCNDLQRGGLAGLGHFQHYAIAEENQPLREERQAFQSLVAGLPGPVCTENSAALLSDPAAAASTDWVRSGIALYGVSPIASLTGHDLGLRPAMTLQAPIYAVHTLQAGESLGYGATFRANREMRIGLVRCGYAHGYPRGLSDGCIVLADGRPATIVGRISMDTLTIDLSRHPDIATGSLVTLWGAAGLPVETVAVKANTIPAQLCTALTAQVPRQPVG